MSERCARSSPGITSEQQPVLQPPPGLELPTTDVSEPHSERPTLSIPAVEWALLRILASKNTSPLTSTLETSEDRSYPLKPPGILIPHPRTSSSVSTASSDGFGEDRDQVSAAPSRSNSPQPLQKMCAPKPTVSRSLQVEAFDASNAHAFKVHWPVDAKQLRSREQ